jgi:hypothetical protein
MPEFKGKLERVDMGPGGWRLRLPDGRKHDLHGPVPPELEGKEVVVQGELGQSVGFLMGGSPIRITEIRRK